MGCNCEPKNYNIKMGCCQPVLGPIEQYYTKYQIDKMLEEIETGITSGCCITPEEVQELINESISGKADVSAITSMSGDTTIISGDVVSLSGDVQNISGDIVAISGDVKSLETKLDTFSGNVENALSGKQDTLTAGEYITIDSANTISTSGLVTVVDNEVALYDVAIFNEYDECSVNYFVNSYSNAADSMEFIVTGWSSSFYDVTNCYFYFINESGETSEKVNGFYQFDTESKIYPERFQQYLNLDLYEFHTTDKYNLHLKYSTKNGWRLKTFFIYLATGYEDGVQFTARRKYDSKQSANVIEDYIYPALNNLGREKFDNGFICNQPLLYEAASNRFRILTTDGTYNTISGATSASTYLARAYDVKNYVAEHSGSSITIDSALDSGSTNPVANSAITDAINTKADITYVQNNYMAKSNIWCGDYTEWAQISGSTQNDVLYLIHQ